MLQLIHTCDIARKAPVGTNGREASQTLASGVACLAIPMSNRMAIMNKFDLGKGWNFYFNSGQDLKVGDKLTYAGQRFAVKSIQQYVMPVVGHIEVVAERVLT